MAAVSAAGDEIVQFELSHYICGYHDYMDIWTPYIREVCIVNQATRKIRMLLQ